MKNILMSLFVALGLFGVVFSPALAAGPEETEPRPDVVVLAAGEDDVSYEIRATYAQTGTMCTDANFDGQDDVSGDPCLALNTGGLMSNIFGWANLIIPVLLPLAAIGIGLLFGSQIVGGLKSFFSGFRIMG